MARAQRSGGRKIKNDKLKITNFLEKKEFSLQFYSKLFIFDSYFFIKN